MSNGWQFSNTPAARVLKAIQVRGKASIKDVAGDLGVTASAVRQHLTQLEASGAVQAAKIREGVGRPYYVYSVTPEGHNLFHKDYGDLARLLLALLLDEVGRNREAGAVQEVMGLVSRRLADLYRDSVSGESLAERLQAWAAMLDRRGVTVEIEQTEDGFELREYGCPFQAVAVQNRAACELERRVMVRLLAPGVELRDCVLDGHHGCRFRITVNGNVNPSKGERTQ
jgi:DeoR family transcriptional regulator, suf operon transcriptional repressor